MQTSVPALILVKTGTAGKTLFSRSRVPAQYSRRLSVAFVDNTLLSHPGGRHEEIPRNQLDGPEGKSRGAIPSLAGLEKKDFVDQMKAFRDGTRPATVMQKHAMGYTDAEFEQLGAWFSAIK